MNLTFPLKNLSCFSYLVVYMKKQLNTFCQKNGFRYVFFQAFESFYNTIFFNKSYFCVISINHITSKWCKLVFLHLQLTIRGRVFNFSFIYAVNCQLRYGKTRVTSYNIRVKSLKARVENLKARVEIQKCEIKSTSYEFKSTSYGFKSASYEFKSTSYEFESTNH